MNEKFDELNDRLAEISDISGAIGLMLWDQMIYMPKGGTTARGRQSGTLRKIAHEKFTDPALGKLLEELRPYEESLDYDSNEASMIRVCRRDYEKATKVPADFPSKISKHTAEKHQAWLKARSSKDFNLVIPHLEKTLEYSREFANFFPGYEHIADPLIDRADYGMKASNIRSLFSELRNELVPIVKKITDSEPIDDSCIIKQYPEDEQLEFSRQIAEDFGYDFECGRLDKSPHPFMLKFSISDVRITTRVSPNDIRSALFSILHEAGHAMYEQGVDKTLEGTIIAGGTSSGVHESQSRLWENIVGRSKVFWKHYYPKLQGVFPDQLSDITMDAFYGTINNVKRSLIRTEADEVTYNLHVMIRFDLELQMLEGKLDIADLAEAWCERYLSDLMIEVPDDGVGVLQDIHWYQDFIGGLFQGYTLGNIMNAQFYEAALKAHPEITEEIGQGKFDTLLDWLTENIYRHGSKFTANELIERVTNGPLNIEPYIRYLKTKYGELYGMTL